jgi:hypothetical protein
MTRIGPEGVGEERKRGAGSRERGAGGEGELVGAAGDEVEPGQEEGVGIEEEDRMVGSEGGGEDHGGDEWEVKSARGGVPSAE